MRLVKSLVLLVALSAVGAGIVAYRAYQTAQKPFQGYTEEEVFFTVDRGASGARIARSLEERGIVRDRRVFVLALRFLGQGRTVKAGEYRFSEPLSTFEVMEKLVVGDVFTFAVTIPEGLTLDETADHLAGLNLAERSTLQARFEERGEISDLDPDAINLEGYLYPTTYRFTRKVRPDEVSQILVNQFKEVFGEKRRARAKEHGLTPRQVVTLASVIEKETAVPEERPLIASVFWNRLRIGMPLQSDPTIIYALKLQGRYDGNLRKADLELDSPYNTYRFPGLPPGPIASPGEASIEAALEPADTSYLYFVSRNDGSHHFSQSYTEHAKAVREYQVEYFRKRRSR
ncbi:MAG: endolytic transglycosylase MltG [Vicinamibacteria bacterium]